MNLEKHVRRSVAAAVVAFAVVAGGAVQADGTTAQDPLAAESHTGTEAVDGSGEINAVRAPSAPRSPTAAPGNARVRLAWLAPSSNGGAAIGAYRVQRSTSSGGPWRTIATPLTRRYTAIGLSNGVRYHFRVAAHNRAGWSPYSTVVDAVPRTVSTAPRSLVATPGNSRAGLAWSAPSSTGGAAVDRYRVQRATAANGPWTTIASPTTRSYTARMLSNGTRYHFRVAAHNAAGWGPYSAVTETVPFTTPGAVPACNASQPFGHGTQSMWIEWSHPSSDGGAPIGWYRVEIKQNNTIFFFNLAPDSQNHGVTLPATGWYEVSVAAGNAAGLGPWCIHDVIMWP